MLPFKIIYTNNVLVLKSRSACAITETSTILVYVILNGKRDLTGCGVQGYIFVSFIF